MRKKMNTNTEPVAIRYDFDGYGYQYMDSGSGSDWLTRVDGELLYTHPAKTLADGIKLLEKYADKLEDERPNKGLSDVVLNCVEMLKKASEK